MIKILVFVAGFLMMVAALRIAAEIKVSLHGHRCPVCRGRVHKDASVCRHCRHPITSTLYAEVDTKTCSKIVYRSTTGS